MSSIRNYLFKMANRYYNLKAETRFGSVVPTSSNQALVEKAEYYNKYIELLKRDVNAQEIEKSKLNDLERKEYEILQRYSTEGIYSLQVNPENVQLQLDKIAVLKKLRAMEENQKDFDKKEVQFYQLVGDFYLEVEGAKEKVEQFIQQNPDYKSQECLLNI